MKEFVLSVCLTLLLISTTVGQTDFDKFVGRWVSNDLGYAMELNFRSDGSGVVDGDNVQWKVGSGVMYVTVDGETESYKYAFNSEGVRFSGGNLEQPLNFKRIKSVVANNSTASNSIDQTLVGKWCYVNVVSTGTGGSSAEECITINSDGTYQYYSERSLTGSNGGTASQGSDSGTWWIEGNRVHYNSQNKGTGYYELIKKNHPKTGDPMIVLDGTAYVTFYKKSPW